MSKIMSVGGYNPSKVAVGVSLDAEGKVQINNPKVDKIIGSIVEPHDDSYRGLVAVLGANCIANVGLIQNPYGKPFKDGNTYILGVANYIYVLDQNLNIIKTQVSSSSGSIVGCYADNDYIYTYKATNPAKIEKFSKVNLAPIKEVVGTSNSFGSADSSGPLTIVGDTNHIYSIMKGMVVKYTKNLDHVASKDLSMAPVSATTSSQYRILGVHDNKLIISVFFSNALSRLFSVDMATLDISEIGSGVIAVTSAIDGDNIVSVISSSMTITDILTGIQTTHPIGGNFGYSPAVASDISGGKYAVAMGDAYPSSNRLEVREVSSKDGYESRVYKIDLDFTIRNVNIDDIGRVWVMGNRSIMLLNDELTLKGYRIV